MEPIVARVHPKFMSVTAPRTPAMLTDGGAALQSWPMPRFLSTSPTVAQRWVIGSAAAALAPMVAVHVAGNGTIDPIEQPISQYAFVFGGFWMILIGSILLAGSAIVIAGAMLHRARAQLAIPAGLLVSFAVAMLLVGFFPTDPAGTATASISATIHRWAAGYAFAVLPVIGLIACRSSALERVHRARLAVLSLSVCAGTALVFAIHLPMAAMGSHIPLFGLIERVGFVVMVAFMIVLSGMLRTAQPRAAQLRTAPPRFPAAAEPVV